MSTSFFSAGPFHLARFSKAALFDKMMTVVVVAKDTERLAQSHEGIFKEVDNHVARVAKVVEFPKDARAMCKVSPPEVLSKRDGVAEPSEEIWGKL